MTWSDAAAAPVFPALGPLEESLRGPHAAQACAQALARLRRLEQSARALAAAGVSPQRYRELEALRDACVAAQEVMEGVCPPGHIPR